MSAYLAFRTLAVIGTAAVVAVLAPVAAADSVYHTEHLDLTPVGGLAAARGRLAVRMRQE